MASKNNTDKKGVFLRAQETLSKAKGGLAGLQKMTDKDFELVVELLQNRRGKIIVSGVGKSGFIAGKIAATLTSLGHQAVYLNPLDALHGDIGIISPQDILIAISYSGESIELIKVIRHAKKEFAISVIAITGKKGSTLSKLSNGVLSFKIKNEGSPLGLAPMASTTVSLVLGDMLASALTSPDSFEEKHFAKFHPGGKLGLTTRTVKDLMATGKRLPFITPSTSLKKALEILTEKYLGIVGVLENNKLIGVVTDGDVRRAIIKIGRLDVTAREIMTKNPKTISPNASLYEALSLMERYKITSVFAVDDKNAVKGALHIHDIIDSGVLK